MLDLLHLKDWDPKNRPSYYKFAKTNNIDKLDVTAQQKASYAKSQDKKTKFIKGRQLSIIVKTKKLSIDNIF